MTPTCAMLSRAVGPPWVDGNLNSHLAMAASMHDFEFCWYGRSDWVPGPSHFVAAADAAGGWGVGQRVHFARWVLRQKPDLFHVTFHARPVTASLLRSALGRVPVVQTVQSAFRSEARMRRSLLGSNLIAVSDRIGRELSTVTDRPVDTIHPVVDATRLQPREPDEAVRIRHGLGEGRFVLYSGNYYPGMGASEAMRVFAALAAEDPDLRFVMANRSGRSRAENRLEREVRDLAVSLGLADRITFLGTIADFTDLLAQASILLFPATDLREQKLDIPLVLLEAMAMAVPIAVFAIEPLDEIGLSRVGVVSVPGDVVGLATQCSELLADEERRREVGVSARSVAIERFSPDGGARKLRRVYERALG